MTMREEQTMSLSSSLNFALFCAVCAFVGAITLGMF